MYENAGADKAHRSPIASDIGRNRHWAYGASVGCNLATLRMPLPTYQRKGHILGGHWRKRRWRKQQIIICMAVLSAQRIVCLAVMLIDIRYHSSVVWVTLFPAHRKVLWEYFTSFMLTQPRCRNLPARVRVKTKEQDNRGRKSSMFVFDTCKRRKMQLTCLASGIVPANAGHACTWP